MFIYIIVQSLVIFSLGAPHVRKNTYNHVAHDFQLLLKGQ